MNRQRYLLSMWKIQEPKHELTFWATNSVRLHAILSIYLLIVLKSITTECSRQERLEGFECFEPVSFFNSPYLQCLFFGVAMFFLRIEKLSFIHFLIKKSNCRRKSYRFTVPTFHVVCISSSSNLYLRSILAVKHSCKLNGKV